ncbi:MAG: pyruvate kinase [Pseudomonadota bacterium]
MNGLPERSAALPDHRLLAALYDEVRELRSAVLADAGRILRRSGGSCAPERDNLAHYLALRSRDLRPLQERLAQCALSSLGRSESHVAATLDRLLALLAAVVGRPGPEPPAGLPDFDAGRRGLSDRRVRLFGPLPPDRPSHILVTLPTAVAEDSRLAAELVAAGMDCARVNCAHDQAAAWRELIARVRTAAAAAGRECRILMDLAGPKLRTGPLAPAESVRLKGPVRLVSGTAAAAGVLGFPAQVMAALKAGDRLSLRDRRGRKRELVIGDVHPDGGLRAEFPRAAELGPDTEFRFRAGRRRGAVCAALRLPEVEIRLFEGDLLLLERAPRPGAPARGDGWPAHISCGEPGVLDQLHPGDPVWIDDGRIGAAVERIDAEGAWLRILEAGPDGRRLRADKGLNFPRSDLRLPALNAKDLRDLDFAARHADLVGLSFAQSLADLDQLRAALAERGAPELPIVAKIETARGVENLAEMLLGTVGRHPLGVMIARGDLMVEIGAERMAELQEEILWLCEAAQVPVIWATQVLETLTKKGTLSRPEITDAAAAARADCVMLNKGPHLERALRVLADILSRMAGHQDKKNPQLRALSLATRVLEGAPSPTGD